MYRIAQTEKKPKANNAQLKKYKPLTSLCNQNSAGKDQLKTFCNREMGTPEILIKENSEVKEDIKSRKSPIVCFNGISEATQREFIQELKSLNSFSKENSRNSDVSVSELFAIRT